MPEETQQSTDDEQATENTDDGAAEVDEDEYTRTTLYFQDSTKREFELWLRQMELDHNIVFEAEKRQQHEALIHVAMNNEEEFVEKLQELMG